MRLTRRGLFKVALAGAATATARAASAREAREPDPAAVGLLYDSTLCIGCQACVVRCKEVNHLPPVPSHGAQYDAPEDLDGRTKNVIKVARDGERSAFFKAQCMHCVDPSCVSVCMLGALHKSVGGIVAYDQSRCIGCRYCQVACPYDVPKFEWAKLQPKIVKCELCQDRLLEGKLPGCVEVCPRQAVIYGKRSELLTEAHRRIDETPGRYQPKVFGEHDGGGTQVLYLSALPFDKLGLPELGNDAPPRLSETIQHGVYRGFIAPAALYTALGVVVWRNRRHPSPDAPPEHPPAAPGPDDRPARKQG